MKIEIRPLVWVKERFGSLVIYSSELPFGEIVVYQRYSSGENKFRAEYNPTPTNIILIGEYKTAAKAQKEAERDWMNKLINHVTPK